MPDIRTFTSFKDYLLLAVVGIGFSLFGVIYNSSQNRIAILETKVEGAADRIDAHAARLATIEAIQVSQRDETFRRLDRIERKLDVQLDMRFGQIGK